MVYIILILLLHTANLSVTADIVTKVPGYPQDFNSTVYSGYLNAAQQSRKMHYIFIQSINGKQNNDPVMLWLNGGPGCSSLLGFLQQIGPYYLQDGANFKNGDSLTFNPHSWHNLANLLFLESPAGVGFSYNLDTQYINNDTNTASDNLNALIDFFVRFPQYKNRPFWIAGQSYAGKYIPDLSVLIDEYNSAQSAQMINFKGILVGNGVMTFQTLFNEQIDYMVDHHFVDPQILDLWKNACQNDPDSARCQLFSRNFERQTQFINPYDVYGYCFYDDSDNQLSVKKKFETQASMLFKTLLKNLGKQNDHRYGGAPCAYFDGVYNYFNLNAQVFHAAFPGQKWNGPCAENISYSMDQDGSLESYSKLLIKDKYKIVLYNGDWDDVVPFRDTLAGLELLNLKPAAPRKPWFTNEQHSGFIQAYNGLVFITVKGASHQVPQAKRAQSLNMVQNIINSEQEDNSWYPRKNKMALQ